MVGVSWIRLVTASAGNVSSQPSSRHRRQELNAGLFHVKQFSVTIWRIGLWQVAMAKPTKGTSLKAQSAGRRILRRRSMFHVKHSIGWPPTSSCSGNGRRPSTWWRRARWTPSGTAISPTPPSCCPWPRSAATWVDLGSGAGFPGLVVALMLAETANADVPSPSCRSASSTAWGRDRVGGIAEHRREAPPTPSPSPQGGGWGGPSPRITLIESNARKCAFLREVVRQTGITPRVAVDILSTRIEAAATQASLQGPDVISARALAPLDRLVDWRRRYPRRARLGYS